MLAGYFNLAQREIKQLETMNNTIVKTENGFYVIPEKVMELKRAEQILKEHNGSCKCGNKTFTHRHTNWIECTSCNKIKVLQD